MSSLPRFRPTTFDEFCFLVKDGQKADLIDGVIYMASPDNTDANDLFMWLGGLLYDYAEAKSLGKVYGSRVAFKVNEINSPEPDIAFVRKERLADVQRGHVKGGPDVAVEIVSPDSIERDYETKRQKYQDAGVQEYWIIDELEHKCTFLRLKNGVYREVRARGRIYRSQAIKGFWFNVDWLWQSPRPLKLDVLKQLLGE